MIGKNIQRIRKRKGLTLSDCAERANISKSYLSNIERDLNKNPSIQIIEKIAGVLDVDLHTLLGTELYEKNQLLDSEWLDFISELRKLGVEKNQLKEFKSLIEFVKWQNNHNGCGEEENDSPNGNDP